MVTGGTAEHQHRPVGAHDGLQRPVLPRLVRQTKRRHDIPYLWSELVHIRHALRAHADRKGPARAAVSNNWHLSDRHNRSGCDTPGSLTA